MNKPDRLLSEEQIKQIRLLPENENNSYSEMMVVVAKAQLTKTDKEWKEWVEYGISHCLVTANSGDCEHYPTCGEDLCGKTCGWWQSRRKEIGK